MNSNRRPTKSNVDLNAYAGIVERLHGWLGERDTNFREAIASLGLAWMAGPEQLMAWAAWAIARTWGKDAPAQPAAPAAPTALPPTADDDGPRRRPNHPGNRNPRAPMLACDDFPGRVLTHSEAAELCGKSGCTYPVSRYVREGRAVPGTTHLFRYATAEEIAAAGYQRRAPVRPERHRRRRRRA